MAEKKIIGNIKLQIPAGKANPSPPVGPALGQKGLNIMDFCNKFNDKTKDFEKGMPIPVVINAYADRSFDFVTKTPPASFLIIKKSKLKKGSSTPGKESVGKISVSDLKEIAEIKVKDIKLPIDSILKMLEGTARSMGVKVIGN
jgi:large subunit ribosomal protein L11